MIEKRFRIIVADTKKFVAKIPIEVPYAIKMLLREGDWKPWDDKTYDSREGAREAESMIGIRASVENKNDHVRDIEEVFK